MKKEEKDNLFNKSLKEKEWVGVIINSDDPLRHFRCKIRIFGLLDDIADNALPWVFPANNLSFSSSTNGGFGKGEYPKEGTIVKVKYPYGDIYSGEYFSIQNINNTLLNEIADDYENCKIYSYDIDENLKFLFTQNQGFLIQLRENIINIDKDNNIILQDSSGQYVKIMNNDDEILIQSNKKVIIDADTSVELGKEAIESILKGETANTLFKQHTHIGNLGAPTSPPEESIPSINLNDALSNKSYTE